MATAARPDIRSIAAGRPFLDDLAAGILADHGQDPLALARVTVLLPTRRACRALAEAFLRQSGGHALLLPAIRPLGDVDEDELDLRGIGAGGDALPFAPLERRLLLARLLLAAPQAGGDPAAALQLADQLGQLLDAAATEEVGLERLPELVPGELARHWQQTLDFLALIREHWPRIKAERGRLDLAEHRQRQMQRWIDHWQAQPPADPVIAAGSTGTIPATARLLRLVARLPQGMVVLPGLDQALDDVAWQAVRAEPTHPQHALALLLERLGAQRGDVAPWPAGAAGAVPRAALLAAALLPPAATADWRSRGGDALPAAAFAGLQRIEAAGPHEEAQAIALAMRETLEQPGRTAALVTPDRMLARRVAAELLRFGITVDDSAGLPLAQTPPAVFLRLILAAVAADCAPVPLLALLKHPFCRAGLPRRDWLRWVRRIERDVLRRAAPAGGLTMLAAALANKAHLLPPLGQLAAALRPLTDLAAQPDAKLPEMLRALIAAAEALAAAAPGDAAALPLWGETAGEALHTLLVDLLAAGDGLGATPPDAWPRLLDALLAGQVVRPRQARHPRLFIWGLLEARLQQADRMILGGLNEGTWPPQAEEDPWLNRPMRAALGLPPPERRLGQTAQDFVLAACAGDVLLTRAAKVDGTPAVPARWLLRLDALLKDDPRWTLAPAAPYAGWAARLDAPAAAITMPPPAPTPPVAARPRSLAVTDIETWIRDPYALYARRILALRHLDPPGPPPDARLRGQVLHDVLAAFLARHRDSLPDADAALAELQALGRAHFGGWLRQPDIAALWWPRFERAAAWFVDWERTRRAAGMRPVLLEQGGSLSFAAPAGDFELRARADRIDRHEADGRLAVLDYKTGKPPSVKQVGSGLSPQLPLEAAIALAGGFPGLAPAPLAELLYLRLSGGDEAGSAMPVESSGRTQVPPPDALAAEALARLRAWVAAFDDPAMPYLSRPRPQFVSHAGDYDHLARVAERAEATGDAE